jgi:hypothetical protein
MCDCIMGVVLNCSGPELRAQRRDTDMYGLGLLTFAINVRKSFPTPYG